MAADPEVRDLFIVEADGILSVVVLNDDFGRTYVVEAEVKGRPGVGSSVAMSGAAL